MAKPQREVPPALEGNDQMIAAVGTGVWAVALIVVFALRDQLPDSDHWWIWTCVVGVGLGVFGFLYVPILKRSRARAQGRRDDLHNHQSQDPQRQDVQSRS